MNMELNDEWINTFEKTDKLYQDFYKDDLYYVNLKFCYVNRNNELDKIKEESFLMSNKNCITREEILQILKKTTVENEIKYSLLSILRYNITLDADDIKNFIIYSSENNENSETSENSFLKTINNIDAIPFEKTINMFQDLNELIFIYYEKSPELKKVDPNNSTKKVFLKTNTNKKTIKNRYKD
jgi:hypothetical protein